MADERFTPRDNLYRFIPRATHGRGRVGVRLTGVGIPENPPVSRETKEQLINFHISSINAMLRAQGRPELSPADYAKVHAAAQLSPNQSSESILQTVLSAATTVAPATNAQDAFKKFLADNQITAEQFNAAQQRHGMLGYAALANFAREMRGSGFDTSGNMSNGVGNTGYTGNLGAISMSNYTTAGSQFSATGMTYGTFNYLRNYTLPDGQRFTGTNILHAGQDTRLHGLDTNDRRIARNFATVDHYDGARRHERNRHLADLAARVAADPEAQRLKREYEAATTEADKQRIAAQAMEHGRKMQNESGYSAFVQNGPEQAKQAGTEIGDDIVARRLGIERRHRPDLPPEAPSGNAPATGQPTSTAPRTPTAAVRTQTELDRTTRAADPGNTLGTVADNNMQTGARLTDRQVAALALQGLEDVPEPPTTERRAAVAPEAPDAKKDKQPVKTADATPPTTGTKAKEPTINPTVVAQNTQPPAPTKAAPKPTGLG